MAGRTVVVQNLTEFSREEQVYCLFSISGYIEAVHMGIYDDTRTPAGFCFVVFEDPASAALCVLYQNGARLDDRILDVKLDPDGFKVGRQIRSRIRETDDQRDSSAATDERPVKMRRKDPGSMCLLKSWVPPRDVNLNLGADGTAVLERGNGECIRVLSEADATLFRENRHLRQVWINGGAIKYAGREIEPADLVISRDWMPQQKYERRPNLVRSLSMCGRRGALLALVQFLTEFGDQAETVVFCGGPKQGWSDIIAEELFPKHKFILFASSSGNTGGQPSDRVEVNDRMFNAEDARRLSELEGGVLFSCWYMSSMKEKATANNLWTDMRDQRRWVETIRPKAAMLHFRLPWTPPAGASEYLDGVIRFNIHQQRGVNSCRLIVTDPDSTRLYDHGDFEGCTYHFVKNVRPQYFEQPYDQDEMISLGLDHSWDCAAELWVLRQYSKKCRECPDDALDGAVLKLARQISELESS